MKKEFSAKEMNGLNEYVRDQYENLKGARFYKNADFLVYLIVVITVALAIRTFLFEPVRVSGHSMIPTLQDKDTMFVEKISYMLHEPERGDIIICYYPGYEESCVKRVIGLPGEKVTILSGKVYIEGKELDESEYWQDDILSWDQMFVVEEDSVFVMGDNRNGSKDSRNSSVGPIPYSKILGKVRSVLWPISSIRTFSKIEY